MPIAYSYSRFSSKAQAKGDSLRRQLSAAYEYAEANGLELDTTLQDHGVSGFSGANRIKGALASFHAMIEAGEIESGSYLLIDSMDRLSREQVVPATLQLLQIAMAGVNVITLNDKRKFDRNADERDMLISVMEIGRAHRESAEKGRKVAKAHAESRRRARDENRIWSRNGPSWLQFDETTKKFVPIPEKVAVVKRIFDMIESGHGTGYIARTFNQERVALLKRGDAGWFGSTILTICRRRQVLGEYQPMKIARRDNGDRYRVEDGEPIAGYYGEGIIDPAQFYRVQAILDGRAANRGQPANVRHFDNLLAGMVKCKTCGGSVGTHFQRAYPNKTPVIRCKTAERGLCTAKVRVPYPPIEKAILEFVSEWEIPTNKPKANPALDKLAQAKAVVTDLSLKVANLTDQAESGSKAILARLGQREAELEAAEKHVRTLEEQSRAGVLELPLKNRHEALRALFKKMDEADPEKLYSLRAAISQALRGVVESVTFNGEPPVDLNGQKVRGDFVTLRMKGDPAIYRIMVHKDYVDMFYVPDADNRDEPWTAKVLSGMHYG